LPADSLPALREPGRASVLAGRRGGGGAARAERECFAERAVLRFVSPLADGADQIAAEVALELGWHCRRCCRSLASITAQPANHWRS
jgi:hypothetical protein